MTAQCSTEATTAARQHKRRKNDQPTAGLEVGAFMAAVGGGRSTYYTIPEKYRPESVKLGRRLLIIESPRDWLLRIQRMGGLPAYRPKRRAVA